jgi:hypothetical protein
MQSVEQSERHILYVSDTGGPSLSTALTDRSHSPRATLRPGLARLSAARARRRRYATCLHAFEQYRCGLPVPPSVNTGHGQESQVVQCEEGISRHPCFSQWIKPLSARLPLLDQYQSVGKCSLSRPELGHDFALSLPMSG